MKIVLQEIQRKKFKTGKYLPKKLKIEKKILTA